VPLDENLPWQHQPHCVLKHKCKTDELVSLASVTPSSMRGTRELSRMVLSVAHCAQDCTYPGSVKKEKQQLIVPYMCTSFNWPVPHGAVLPGKASFPLVKLNQYAVVVSTACKWMAFIMQFWSLICFQCRGQRYKTHITHKHTHPARTYTCTHVHTRIKTKQPLPIAEFYEKASSQTTLLKAISHCNPSHACTMYIDAPRHNLQKQN
jgi:hypothetical protein